MGSYSLILTFTDFFLSFQKPKKKILIYFLSKPKIFVHARDEIKDLV